ATPAAARSRRRGRSEARCDDNNPDGLLRVRLGKAILLPMQESGLAGEDLRLGYHGHEVVTGASIRIAAGRITALVGPNGSGKSTLLRALARLHRRDGGRVVFPDGTEADELSATAFARRVTLLTQSRPTPGGVSVRDVVGYGRHPYRGRWRHD